MKNGLFFENDSLIYYKDGHRVHAGAVEIDGDIYYISSGGHAVKGQHIVHSEMGNGILERGTYTFGDDYKLVKGSFIRPKKRKLKKTRKGKKSPRVRTRISKKGILRIIGAVLACILLILVVYYLESRIDEQPPVREEPAAQEGSQTVQVVLPDFEEEVLLCSDAAKELYDHEGSIAAAVGAGDPYRPFAFAYALEGTDGILLLSETPELTGAKEYILEEGTGQILVDNLKPGTSYYYKVTANGTDYPGTFQTAPSTRFLSIPGTENTRDIGGYVTQDGHTIRQDLLIRGTELDGLTKESYLLPDDDISAVQSTFGFVYDFDLRSPSVYSGDYQSRLGRDVDHRFYDAPQYGQIFNTSYQPALREIFRDLAEPEHYPMYMHCTWGRDRTGTIIFLLQGVLNLSEEDMLLEYRRSAFSHPDLVDAVYMEAVIDGLQPYEGDTLQEKIVSFLTTDVGVSEEEIASIRAILLEQ